MTRTPLTLCFIHDDTRILLGMKKRGFGAGKWNGFGGKVEAGETIEDAARRETYEEIGIEVNALAESGALTFIYPRTEQALDVSVFRVETFQGEPKETDEMRPAWFPIDAIPFERMWLDDPHWLPIFLAGKRFEGRFVFEDDDTLLEYAVREV